MSNTATETASVNPEKEAAEIEKLRAEAAFQRAQTEKELALAEVARIEARRIQGSYEFEQIRTDELRVEHERKYASDHYNHVYRFNGGVDSHSVDVAIKELTIWDRTAPNCDIEIVFNSPGGSVIDGNALFDFIRELRSKNHFVTTVTYGWAASMGGILLQAGDNRVMGREAVVLIHEVSTLAGGKIGEIEDEVELIHKFQDRVLSTFVEGSRKAFENGTSERALSREEFVLGNPALGIKGWQRRDWWLTSDECLRYGIVDEVR